MAYAFLVLTILSLGVWCAAGYVVWRLYNHMTAILPTMIDDVISRQDSRIERRVERRENKDVTSTQQDDTGVSGGGYPPPDGVVRAGVPMRRR